MLSLILLAMFTVGVSISIVIMSVPLMPVAAIVPSPTVSVATVITVAAPVIATVSPAVVTTISGTAKDAAGNVSACSTTLTYEQNASAVGVPTLGATVPASPSNSVLNPMITGTAEAGVTVKLFTNPSCSGSPVATGVATRGELPKSSARAESRLSVCRKFTQTRAAPRSCTK